MEPPSPILKPSDIEAGTMSDDPLSNCIFMILGNSSDSGDGTGCHVVCAYNAQTGLSYIGTTGSTVS